MQIISVHTPRETLYENLLKQENKIFIYFASLQYEPNIKEAWFKLGEQHILNDLRFAVSMTAAVMQRQVFLWLQGGVSHVTAWDRELVKAFDWLLTKDQRSVVVLPKRSQISTD